MPLRPSSACSRSHSSGKEGSAVRGAFRSSPLREKIVSFVRNVYVPDVCAIAGFYPDWFSYGAGVTNYLSVPDLPLDGKSTQFECPGGFIPNGDLSKLIPITGQKDETWRRVDVDEMTTLAVRSEDRYGLGCRDAMLFDGGPSAQMYLAGSAIGMEGDRVPVFVVARRRER